MRGEKKQESPRYTCSGKSPGTKQSFSPLSVWARREWQGRPLLRFEVRPARQQAHHSHASVGGEHHPHYALTSANARLGHAQARPRRDHWVRCRLGSRSDVVLPCEQPSQDKIRPGSRQCSKGLFCLYCKLAGLSRRPPVFVSNRGTRVDLGRVHRGTLKCPFHDVLLAGGDARQGGSLCPAR
jgi:hypothetical protein